jgi:GNAT superfamily N-acetyltransferase
MCKCMVRESVPYSHCHSGPWYKYDLRHVNRMVVTSREFRRQGVASMLMKLAEGSNTHISVNI